jgi:hypothetical protein
MLVAVAVQEQLKAHLLALVAMVVVVLVALTLVHQAQPIQAVVAVAQGIVAVKVLALAVLA